MNRPSNQTHAEELLGALNRIDELQIILRERAYLHPMDMVSNITNIQALLLPDISIEISKAGICIIDKTLHIGTTCQPEDVPAALEMKQFLMREKARISDE